MTPFHCHRHLFYRLFYGWTTLLLVVWLAAFAPATCAYHGFLLGRSPINPPLVSGQLAGGGHQHLHHHSHGGHTRLALMTAPTSDNPCATSLGAAQWRHQPVSGDASLMSLLAIALPNSNLVEAPANASALLAIPLVDRLEVWPPPEQPPRPR